MTTALQWARWWCHAWRDAHTDWYPQALGALPAPRLDALARGHHAAIARCFGMTPCTPPPPAAAVQALLCGPPQAFALACELVAATCSPLTATGGLPPEDGAWCERTAKALRPGAWLEPGQDPLALLRPWLGEPAWERARLVFPASRIAAIEARPTPRPPPSKLDTLWQSACWKAQQKRATPAPTQPEMDDARSAFA